MSSGIELLLCVTGRTAEGANQEERVEHQSDVPAAQASSESTIRDITSRVALLESNFGSVTEEVEKLMRKFSKEGSGKGKQRDVDKDITMTDSSISAHGQPHSTHQSSSTYDLAGGSKAPRSSVAAGVNLENPEDRANLYLLVDNIVSSKMLSLNQSLNFLKPSVNLDDRTPGIGSESSTQVGSPNPTEPYSSLSSIPNGSGNNADGSTINNLLAEIKALREEASARERRAKDEWESLRRLHSVEVDALRRRLAYLESQALTPLDIFSRRYPPYAAEYSMDSASAPPSKYYNGAEGEDLRQRHHSSGVPRVESYRHFPNHERYSTAHEAEKGASITFSRSFSPTIFINGRKDIPVSGSERANVDEEGPLPIKSQRKQHIIGFSRHFPG